MVGHIIGWSLRITPLILAVLFLNYYLPSYDTVYIVGTDVKRMDVGASGAPREGVANTAVGMTRDVRFINAVWPDGQPRVYRNEETGWGFPWYFKFDSGNLQTLAQRYTSTEEAPRWVVVKHYGWRIEFLSMFPNAVSLEPAAGPNDTPFSWQRAIGFLLFALLVIALWRLWVYFKNEVWEPFLARLELDQRFENANSWWRQIWRWLKASFRDRVDTAR